MDNEEFITMKDLHDRYKGLPATEIVLDVRSPEEYMAGHVPGSKNIPHDSVRSHFEDLKRFRKVYIHCRSGGRAKQAYETLSALGLTNMICVTGSGMDDWVKSGYPIQKK